MSPQRTSIPTPKVPETWSIVRLKTTIHSAKNGVWGDEPTGSPTDIPCVRVADFDRVKLVAATAPTVRSVEPSQRNGRVLQRGDLLLEKSGGGDTQPVGCVVRYEISAPAVCSNFVARVTVAAEHDSRFLTYVHAALYFAGITARSIKQTTGIQNLDASAYFDERVALPPATMQRAIADFLDRKTAAIDGLIAKKERLIELLQEKRQALITRAVTKGLEPNVPMKDSGIEWLGEIPAHWEVKRLKHICLGQSGEIQMGPFGASLVSVQREPDAFCVYGQSNVIAGDFSSCNRWLTVQQFQGLHKYELEPGDLVLSRKGSVGHCQIAPPGLARGIIDSDTIRIRPNQSKADGGYIQLVLQNASYISEQMKLNSRGAILQGLNTSVVGGLQIALPPVGEQKRLLGNVGEMDAHMEQLRERADRQVETLHEYRQALITAAVTGQLEVAENIAEEAVA